MELFGIIFLVLVIVLVYVGHIFLWMTLYQRAGFSGWWGLFAIVPQSAVILLIVLASAQWPIRKELLALRFNAGTVGQQDMRDLSITGLDYFNKGQYEDAARIYEYIAAHGATGRPLEEARKMLELIHQHRQAAASPSN